MGLKTGVSAGFAAINDKDVGLTPLFVAESVQIRSTVKEYDVPVANPVAVHLAADESYNMSHPAGATPLVPPVTKRTAQDLKTHPCIAPACQEISIVEIAGTLGWAAIPDIFSALMAGAFDAETSLQSLSILSTVHRRIILKEYDTPPVRPVMLQDLALALYLPASWQAVTVVPGTPPVTNWTSHDLKTHAPRPPTTHVRSSTLVDGVPHCGVPSLGVGAGTAVFANGVLVAETREFWFVSTHTRLT
jgi:hypothetical protein